MSNVLFRDMTGGSPIYALIKKSDEILYSEGSIVTVGQQRVEVQQQQQNTFPLTPSVQAPRTVVDVTYCIDGKNYTDAVDITAYMFPTEKTGAVTLVATDKEPIVRELRATLKKAEDYLKSVETEVPRNQKKVDDCKTLISLLDTEYAEKQEWENRIKKLEDGSAETHKLLNEILKKLSK